tara:strand:+ start:424 stop:690 length:267 start_codon:yes stop_codon:yes gene_type:complete
MDNLHIEIIFSKEGEIYTRQNLAHKRAKVEKVGGLNKAKRWVTMQQKLDNVENHVMYEAQKYRKQERNAKNNSSKKAKKLAKRKKNIV